MISKIHIKSRTAVILFFISVSFGIWFLYHQNSASEKIARVLLISIDTCRSDYLNCYGYRHKTTTPNIDAIAAEGILFENVITPVPMTLPAHASMLTGTIPPYHGIHDNINYQLGQSNVTLAEILKDNGFTTGALISAYVLDSDFGLDQGFDTYNDRFEEESKTTNDIEERRGEETTRLCLQWLHEHKEERFFYFLHYFDPHAGYEPPEPFRSRFSDNLYAGEIAFTDHCIGLVIDKLKKLGLYDSTLIIITGDHGEMLGEHGEAEHQYFIYQSAIKVPLIFKLPSQRKARRIKDVVGLIDIVPTVCSSLGIKLPSQVQGKDLTGYFKKQNSSNSERYLYCESLAPTKYNANTLLGIVTRQFKYIQTTRPELYDLTKDPGETTNLVAKLPKRADLLKKHLSLILEEQFRENSDSKLDLDETARNKLTSLGYVGGSVNEDFSFDQTRDDPKDVIDFHNAASEISYLIALKKYSKAKEVCLKLLKQRPDYSEGHFALGVIAMEQDDFAGAVSYFKKSLKLKPDQFLVHSKLAVAYQQLGDYEQSIKHCKESLRIRPGSPSESHNLGVAYYLQAKYDEAINCFIKTLEIAPESALTYSSLGLAQIAQGKFEEAVKNLKKSLEIKPKDFFAHNYMASAMFKQGKFDQTIAHYKKSLDLSPAQPEVLWKMGNIFLQQGKNDQAVDCFKSSLKLDPDRFFIHNDLATALLKQGESDQAISHYKKSLELNPNQPDILCITGNILLKQGMHDDAIIQYKRAMQLNPELPLVQNCLADWYFQQGQFEQAITHWNHVLKINPDSFAVLNNIAWLKATYENEDFYDPGEAVQLAHKACELTDFKKPELLDTLSIAYAAEGNFSKAIEIAEKAFVLAIASKQKNLAQELKSRLQQYKDPNNDPLPLETKGVKK